MRVQGLLLAILLLVVMAGAPGWADLVGVAYTGPLFTKVGGNVLSAQIDIQPRPSGAWPTANVLFNATTLWGQKEHCGPALTDGAGSVVALATWPTGVYRLVTGAAVGQQSVYAAEDVLTIFSPYVRGLAVGGAFQIGDPAVPGSVGFIYQNMGPVYIPPMGSAVVSAPYANLRSFIFDVKGLPGGLPRLSVWTTDFKSVLLYTNDGGVTALELVGKCYYQENGGRTRYLNLDAVFDFISNPSAPLMSIKVWQALPYAELLDETGIAVTGGAFWKF